MVRLVVVGCVVCTAVSAVTVSAFGGSQPKNPVYDAAVGKSAPVSLKVRTPSGAIIRVRKDLPVFSAGVLSSIAHQSSASRPTASSNPAGLGQAPESVGCSERNPGGDVRVNQDCGYQLQAEEGIASNPTDPSNLIAGHIDTGSGAPFCSADWSTDGGRHWGTQVTPQQNHLNDPTAQLPTAADPNRNTLYGDAGSQHPYWGASDPGVAFDSHGRAFVSCAAADLFNGDFASGLFVVASPAGARGSFYTPLAESTSVAGPGEERRYMVVEDNTVRVFHDKPLLTADAYPRSPNRDNVYVTWTAILSDAQGNLREEPIYGSMSTDHGVTWSTPEEISGNSRALCVGGNSLDPSLRPSACNMSTGSDPKVLPNGDLAVAFWNFNTPSVNNQELAVDCHPTGSSTAGTAHFNCRTPTKIGDDIRPRHPSCAGIGTCIPGPYVRVFDWPRLAVNPANGHLYAVWNDYRNGEWDIQMASSSDGGRIWSATSTVNPDRGLDHFMAAVDIGKGGAGDHAGAADRVGVSYQRSNRVPNENTRPAGGFAPGQPGVQAASSDTVLAGGTGPATPYPFTVIGPAFPPPDGNQTGFLGDYTGITIPSGTDAHPIWADARNIDPFASVNGSAHDEDIFTNRLGLPNGVGRVAPGTIGQSSSGGGGGSP